MNIRIANCEYDALLLALQEAMRSRQATADARKSAEQTFADAKAQDDAASVAVSKAHDALISALVESAKHAQ